MATFAGPVSEPNVGRGSPALPWATVLWFGILLTVCYAPMFAGLARQWLSDEDMSHGFFVPLVAGFIAWSKRSEWAGANLSPNYWGLVLTGWGAMQALVGTLAAQIFVARTAFLFSIVGVIVLVGGVRLLKILAFPLFLLVFLFPIPAIVYARITLPLQLFASSVAETMLSLVGIPVLRDGNVLELASQRLSVVEACSGIRSLLSLGFLALVYGYFFDKKVWMRWLLFGATVPIAIAANAFRVALTGLISEYRTDLAQGFLHVLEGWVLFMLALLLIVSVQRLVNKCMAS
jgi:exosortase